MLAVTAPSVLVPVTPSDAPLIEAPALPIVPALTVLAVTAPRVLVPVTPNELNVPREVILVWAAVDIVPTKLAPVLPIVPA